MSYTKPFQSNKIFMFYSSSIDSPVTSFWVQNLYQYATKSNTNTSLNFGLPVLNTMKEPFGVVVIEFPNDKALLETSLTLIAAAIASGNSIIIINEDNKFIKEIASRSTLPAGILNVVEASDIVVNTLKGHQEVEIYYAFNKVQKISMGKNQILQDISFIDDHESFISNVTKTKCIWISAGESFQ